MTVLVVSCYLHREAHQPQPVDWPQLVGLLDRSAARVGARHLCITDAATAPSLPCETHIVAGLPEDLMRAWVAAQHAFLRDHPWPGDLVLVGADCLVARPLAPAFGDEFDVAVTSRPGGGPQGINNGAIYVPAHGRAHAKALLKRACATCRTHWGADQESIAAALSPVPVAPGTIELRHGARIAFRGMRGFNFSPDKAADAGEAFVVHFKGTRKAWMPRWAAQHLGLA